MGDDLLFGGAGNDSIVGGEGNDGLIGGGVEGGGAESAVTVGGKDTLVGGVGNDSYFVSAIAGGGSEIRDTGGTTDILLTFADVDSFETVEDFNNPESYGDAAIVVDFPQPGIVGLYKADTDLIIDLNRDGVAVAESDLVIVDFFDTEGELGNGSIEEINNLGNTEPIAEFFDKPSETVYRFFNNKTGVHFYTASAIERNSLLTAPNDFAYENTSYLGVDSLTGGTQALPVYRFLNQDTGVHLYTIDENERDFLQENQSNYSFEGEVFSAYGNEVEGSIPIYRFFNPVTGAHFYTPSLEERNNVNELPNFQSEGIAYYGLPIESETDSVEPILLSTAQNTEF